MRYVETSCLDGHFFAVGFFVAAGFFTAGFAATAGFFRAGYRRMRDTWELLVEELMFAGAVKRFRRSIETRKLRMVSVEDDDVAAVFAGMTRCSNFTHEGGAEAPPPLPEPDAFMADIDNLGQAVANIIARNKEVEKRREAAGISA